MFIFEFVSCFVIPGTSNHVSSICTAQCVANGQTRVLMPRRTGRRGSCIEAVLVRAVLRALVVRSRAVNAAVGKSAKTTKTTRFIIETCQELACE